MARTLRPTKSPNQPIAPVDYDQRFQDQFSNALRLYFTELDNFTGVLIANNGGRFLNFPHISASDSTNQYTTTDTPKEVYWNTLETGSGFTLNAPGSATADYSGVYKIDYSLELANTDNAIHNVSVWLRVDGIDVANSATDFSIPARKSAGVPSYLCAYSHITFPILGGQTIELIWATDQAYSALGPVNGVYMLASPAQTAPPAAYARPAIPSAVGTIAFVSEIDQ